MLFLVKNGGVPCKPMRFSLDDGGDDGTIVTAYIIPTLSQTLF
jgi:hypothetical protein